MGLAAQPAEDTIVLWMPGPKGPADDRLHPHPLEVPGQVLLDSFVLVLFCPPSFLEGSPVVVEGAVYIDDDAVLNQLVSID